MTTILVIQCLVFGDGGLTALGPKPSEHGRGRPAGSFGVLKVTKERPDNWSGIGVPLAAWASVLTAALLCGVQLALSYSLSGGSYGIEGMLSIPTMGIYHAIIGVGEAIITTGVVVFLNRVAPETLEFGMKSEEARA